MTYIPGQSVFLEALKDRYTKVPFTHMSAHRVREGSDNIGHEGRVVAAITRYVSAPKAGRHVGMLIGCVADDVHVRLCAIPDNIERQLGYNVISGIENLNLHRVPEPAIDAFVAVIEVRIRLLLKECESARELLRQPIAQEYRRLIVGTSLLPQLCADAAQIAEDCVGFCDRWGA